MIIDVKLVVLWATISSGRGQRLIGGGTPRRPPPTDMERYVKTASYVRLTFGCKGCSLAAVASSPWAEQGRPTIKIANPQQQQEHRTLCQTALPKTWLADGRQLLQAATLEERAAADML